MARRKVLEALPGPCVESRQEGRCMEAERLVKRLWQQLRGEGAMASTKK